MPQWWKNPGKHSPRRHRERGGCTEDFKLGHHPVSGRITAWEDNVSCLFLLLDVRADPVSPLPWGPLILLLVIVFVLAVGFVVALVVLLIWLKRRKLKEAAAAGGSPQ